MEANKLYYTEKDLEFVDAHIDGPAVFVCTNAITYKLYIVYSAKRSMEKSAWMLGDEDILPFIDFLKSPKYNNTISKIIIKNLF